MTLSGTSGIPQYGRNVMTYDENVNVMIATLDGVSTIILVHANRNAIMRPMALYMYAYSPPDF